MQVASSKAIATYKQLDQLYAGTDVSGEYPFAGIAGMPVERILVRPAVTRRTFSRGCDTQWDCDVEFDEEGDDSVADGPVVELEPARYSYRVPPHIAALLPVRDLGRSIVWMLETMSVAEIDSIYRLLSRKEFRITITEAYRKDRHAHATAQF